MQERIGASPSLYRFAAARTSALLKNNESYRDRHAGETAYVVATGPSVALQDLTALAGSIVISVNENFSYLQRRGLTPAYNVVQDENYFKEDRGYRGFHKDIARFSFETEMVSVLPVGAAANFNANAELARLHRAYFFQLGDFLALSARGPTQIDFTRPMPSQLTVSHTAIAWALFIGCRTIHVLGVDLDFGDDLNQPIKHCYGVNPYNENDRLSTIDLYERTSRLKWVDISNHIALQKQGFDALDEIAQKRGQTVFDASLHGRVGAVKKMALPKLTSATSAR